MIISEKDCALTIHFSDSVWGGEYVRVMAKAGTWQPNPRGNATDEQAAWALAFVNRAKPVVDEFGPCGRHEFANEAEAEAHLDALLAAHNVGAQARSTGKHCYIRYGKLPTGGYSRNHRDGTLEKGVSTYSAYEMNGTLYVDMAGVDGISAAFIMGRTDIYIVSGTEVGRGSDGEPILSNAKARRTRKPTQIIE